MSRKVNLILVGFGGHANACLDIIENSKKYKILGYVDKKKRPSSLKYLGNDSILNKIQKKNLFIGIGQIKKNPRKKIFNFLSKNNKFPKIISKTSVISKNSTIGDGTIIMNNVHIGPNVKIGKNCIINTGAIIEHDVTINNHCHISTGAIINGGSEIGENSFIGSGSVVKQGIKIDKKSFYNACLFIAK
jgi:sugar O-acyltransferase, sialic acid O-acetyltransferase NeuD family